MFITVATSETTTSRISTTASEVSTPSRSTTEYHIAEGALKLFHCSSVGVDIYGRKGLFIIIYTLMRKRSIDVMRCQNVPRAHTCKYGMRYCGSISTKMLCCNSFREITCFYALTTLTVTTAMMNNPYLCVNIHGNINCS